MYTPRHFKQEDIGVMQAFMQQYDFATLITRSANDIHATHLPFVLEPDQGPYGTLSTHMARANPQWKTFAETETEALVIFQGPHAYISPQWYADQENSVPTWNYTAVHARGIPRIESDPAAVYEMLKRLVDVQEAVQPDPWSITRSEDYTHHRIPALVALTLEITRLEGKFKLSQNRSREDRQQVIDALQSHPDTDSRMTAHLMAQNEDE